MLKHTNWALRICLLSFITLVSVMNVKAQITFNASNKSIKEVIEMIEEKADYSFFYSDELSDLNRKVNLSFHDENIENVLRTLFKGTNIVYKIEGDKQVVLSLQSTLKKAKSNKSVSGKIGAANSGCSEVNPVKRDLDGGNLLPCFISATG